MVYIRYLAYPTECKLRLKSCFENVAHILQFMLNRIQPGNCDGVIIISNRNQLQSITGCLVTMSNQ